MASTIFITENLIALRRVLLAVAFGGAFIPCSPAAVFYVNQAVAGGNRSGNSWANAERELGEALEKVRAANDATPGTITEVWVAAGTYKPTHYAGPAVRIIPSPWQMIPVPNKESDKAFRMMSNVRIYGGFAGTETSIAQRDWEANPTILSGDVGVVGDASDNCNHVVLAINVDGNATLDGFTITGGNARTYSDQTIVTADGQRIYTDMGGGLLADGSGGFIDYLRLANLVIRDNRAAQWAGGLMNGESSLELFNVHLWDNHCDVDGGGIWSAGFADMHLYNCSIKGNTAGRNGAGIWSAGSSSYMTNCLVTGNRAEGDGGGLWMWSDSYLTNVTLAGNRAKTAGGVETSSDYGPLVLFRNSIVKGNVDDNGTSDLNGITEVRSSLVGDDWHDTDGEVTQPTGISAADLFVDPLPASGAPTSGGDYHLAAGSFAINRGDDWRFSPGQTPDISAITTDLDGEDRFVGASIDLGPFESAVDDSDVEDWVIY